MGQSSDKPYINVSIWESFTVGQAGILSGFMDKWDARVSCETVRMSVLWESLFFKKLLTDIRHRH